LVSKNTYNNNNKMDHSLHHIKGLIILDNEGKRMFAKFYDPSINHEQQLSIEKSFYAKTAKYQNQNTDVDVLIQGDLVCVFKHEIDLFFYLFASAEENELVCAEVLCALLDGLQLIFRNQLEKRTFLENFDLIVLAVDEVIDDGIIMEIDPQSVAQKVASTDTGLSSSGASGEESDALNQVFTTAKEQVSEIASSLFSF
jgi:hypothetical protein